MWGPNVTFMVQSEGLSSHKCSNISFYKHLFNTVVEILFLCSVAEIISIYWCSTSIVVLNNILFLWKLGDRLNLHLAIIIIYSKL